MKPDLFDFDAGTAISIEQLASRILAVPGLEGVTYSGGEPFEQALPLAQLSSKLRASGLTVLVYSGYRLDALRREAKFRLLLDQTDILIDGEFQQELLGPLRWRGSSNQRIHILSKHGHISSSGCDNVCEVQTSITADALRLTGFPSDEFQRALSARLYARGIVMRPADLGDAEL